MDTDRRKLILVAAGSLAAATLPNLARPAMASPTPAQIQSILALLNQSIAFQEDQYLRVFEPAYPVAQADSQLVRAQRAIDAAGIGALTSGPFSHADTIIAEIRRAFAEGHAAALQAHNAWQHADNLLSGLPVHLSEQFPPA